MFIVLEGVDCTGKSTVAEIYKKQGYEVVHVGAPSKKYKDPGYTGPSYLDDLLELVMQQDGKDTLWDRSWYGESIWPHVYGREPLFSEDDLEIFQEFESRNSTQRILMMDPDMKAHWQRCVDNKEPLNIQQFKVANALYNKMAHKYNFSPKELKDFKDVPTTDNKQNSAPDKQEELVKSGQSKITPIDATVNTLKLVPQAEEETELAKLEKANAIRDVLSKQIFKSKSKTFDELEKDVRQFLKDKLSELLGTKSIKNTLTDDEVVVLKVFCQRLKEKEGKSK